MNGAFIDANVLLDWAVRARGDRVLAATPMTAVAVDGDGAVALSSSLKDACYLCCWHYVDGRASHVITVA